MLLCFDVVLWEKMKQLRFSSLNDFGILFVHLLFFVPPLSPYCFYFAIILIGRCQCRDSRLDVSFKHRTVTNFSKFTDTCPGVSIQ